MIPKLLWLPALIVLSVSSVGHANGWEANLNAGNTSVLGGLHYSRDFGTGYMKTGVSVLYADDDKKEYKWAEVKFTVGRDNIQPGLNCEVGLKGIVGDGEQEKFTGDVGALAFTGYIGYLFAQQKMPIPVEIFGNVSYAPEVLSFRDTENFLSYNFGFGVRIMPSASIILEYNAFDMDLEESPRPWNLDDSVVRLGLVMRF